MKPWEKLVIIERRYIGNRGYYPDSEWRLWSSHNWTDERSQMSIDRLNRLAPRSWEYRFRRAPVEAMQVRSHLANTTICSWMAMGMDDIGKPLEK